MMIIHDWLYSTLCSCVHAPAQRATIKSNQQCKKCCKTVGLLCNTSGS